MIEPERIVVDTVVVGNCPTCNAFPVQHIATEDGGIEHRFIQHNYKHDPRCDCGPHKQQFIQQQAGHLLESWEKIYPGESLSSDKGIVFIAGYHAGEDRR